MLILRGVDVACLVWKMAGLTVFKSNKSYCIVPEIWYVCCQMKINVMVVIFKNSVICIFVLLYRMAEVGNRLETLLRSTRYSYVNHAGDNILRIQTLNQQINQRKRCKCLVSGKNFWRKFNRLETMMIMCK